MWLKMGDTRGPCPGGTVWCPEPGGGSRNLHLIKLHRTRADLNNVGLNRMGTLMHGLF